MNANIFYEKEVLLVAVKSMCIEKLKFFTFAFKNSERIAKYGSSSLTRILIYFSPS
jgi:hypothetical protein